LQQTFDILIANLFRHKLGLFHCNAFYFQASCNVFPPPGKRAHFIAFAGGQEPGVKIIGGPSTPRSPVCRRPYVSRRGRPHTSWCCDPRWYSRGKTTRRTLARCRSRCTMSYSREAGTILRSPSYTGRLQRSRNLTIQTCSQRSELNSTQL